MGKPRHRLQRGAFGAPSYGYDCVLCEAQGRARGEIEWFERGFIVCPVCGNKRCPKATWHEQACTNSNQTGQVGSIYGEPPMALLKIWMKEDDA